ncbi:hypothetical protein [Corynebacterium dentalis]|uniref:hypothetical protein n=1 Tax=Corynebacterium dentalis TaxID=2014528 RepID=UPI0028A16C60|nr:hypothetical protein [Corynebacterium dentalis]
MNPERPDLALLNEKQLVAIREDLAEMREKQPWAEITQGDIDRLHYLHLCLEPEVREGRGHDCRWMWSNGEIIIEGNTDVYGHRQPATYCRPNEWWLTADNEEYEP